MFQPRSGTDPSLGSIANVTSYLFPYQLFNCFWIIALHPLCTDPPPIHHPYTELHRSLNPSLLLFRSWTVFTPEHTSNPSGLHRLYLRSLFCWPQPATQVPVGPCSPAPQACFFCLSPHTAALEVATVPVNPCGFFLLGSILTPPFPEPPPMLGWLFG